MSYFETAAAGHTLTPYQRLTISRFFRDAEATKITRDDFGYNISIGDCTYPLLYSLEDAIEELQSLLIGHRAAACLPLAVVVEIRPDGSWGVDMEHAVSETRYALESE